VNKEEINKALKRACEKYTAYLSTNNKPVHCPAQEYVEPKDNMRETLETLLDNLGLGWWRKELQNKLLYQDTRYDLILPELIGEQLVKENNPELKWDKYKEIYINVIKTITIPTPLWIVNEDWMALARKFKLIFRPCDRRKPSEIPPFGFLDYFDSCENRKADSLFGAISFILDKSTDFSDARLTIYSYRNFITGVGGDGTHRIYASVLLAPLIERIRLSISVIEIDGLKLTEFLKQLSTDGTTQP
jgi:hypothetical protein